MCGDPRADTLLGTVEEPACPDKTTPAPHPIRLFLPRQGETACQGGAEHKCTATLALVIAFQERMGRKHVNRFRDNCKSERRWENGHYLQEHNLSKRSLETNKETQVYDHLSKMTEQSVDCNAVEKPILTSKGEET